MKQLGEQPDILLENERLNLNYTDTVVTVKVVSNVEYEVEIPQNADWIKEMKQQVQVRAMAESERTFSIERNEDDTVRYISVVFRSVDQKVERSLMFRQGHRDKEYKPGDPIYSCLSPVERPVNLIRMMRVLKSHLTGLRPLGITHGGTVQFCL